MAHITVTKGKVEIAQFQTLLVTKPTPEVIQLVQYRLVYLDRDFPKNYRVFKGIDSLGLVFRHQNYWSRGNGLEKRAGFLG